MEKELQERSARLRFKADEIIKQKMKDKKEKEERYKKLLDELVSRSYEITEYINGFVRVFDFKTKDGEEAEYAYMSNETYYAAYTNQKGTRIKIMFSKGEERYIVRYCQRENGAFIGYDSNKMKIDQKLEIVSWAVLFSREKKELILDNFDKSYIESLLNDN